MITLAIRGGLASSLLPSSSCKVRRVLRAGLASIREDARRTPSRPFSTKTYPSKCLLPADMASTHDMLAFAEGEDWR